MTQFSAGFPQIPSVSVSACIGRRRSRLSTERDHYAKSSEGGGLQNYRQKNRCVVKIYRQNEM